MPIGLRDLAPILNSKVFLIYYDKSFCVLFSGTPSLSLPNKQCVINGLNLK